MLLIFNNFVNYTIYSFMINFPGCGWDIPPAPDASSIPPTHTQYPNGRADTCWPQLTAEQAYTLWIMHEPYNSFDGWPTCSGGIVCSICCSGIQREGGL